MRVITIARRFDRALPAHAALAGFLLLMLLTGALGALFGPDEWYAGLRKASWNPPNTVFAPVWSILYVLIAIAGWRVMRDAEHPWARRALTLWFVQWFLNGIWTMLFFGLHAPLFALTDILLLIVVVAAFARLAWPNDRTSAVLFLPYLAWIAFAASLNAAIVWLNQLP